MEIYRVFEVKKYWDFDSPREAEQFIDSQKEDEFGIVPSFVTRPATYEELNETVSEMEESNFKGTPAELTAHMDRITEYKEAIKEIEEKNNYFGQLVSAVTDGTSQKELILTMLSGKFGIVSVGPKIGSVYSVNLQGDLTHEELLKLLQFLA